MFSTYRKPLLALSILFLVALATFQIVSAQIYLPLIHNGRAAAGTDVRHPQVETTAALPPAEAPIAHAAEPPSGKKLDTRPTWEITVPGTDRAVAWVDHQPNPRFAIWDMGTSDLRDDVVLDKETGLVWEREPEAATTFWFAAQLHCMERAKGGRTGWRLPTIEELLTLPDPASTAQLWLPDGHPFVERAFTAGEPYWSATSLVDTDPGRQNRAHTIILYNWDNLSFPDRFGTLDKGGESGGYLCVRGGSGQDLQHFLSGGT